MRPDVDPLERPNSLESLRTRWSEPSFTAPMRGNRPGGAAFEQQARLASYEETAAYRFLRVLSRLPVVGRLAGGDQMPPGRPETSEERWQVIRAMRASPLYGVG